MDMRLCPSNHYYDKSIHCVCPHCVGVEDIGKTVAGAEAVAEAEADAYQASLGRTAPVGVARTAPLGAARTAPLGAVSARQNIAGRRADGGRDAAPVYGGQTKAMIQYEIGLDPVVGWLVCVEGKSKGRDYRIHAENNFIGRDPSMDIAISGDEAVSRQNHAIISYDTREKAYYFAQGTGRSIVRVNGKAMLSTVRLEAYDRLEIGDTKLVFVPLLGEGFDWLAIG